MVNKVPGMKTNDGSQVSGCQGRRQGEGNMRRVEKEEKMEGYKAFGRKRKKERCTSEEEENQEGSERRCRWEEVEVVIQYKKKGIE